MNQLLSNLQRLKEEAPAALEAAMHAVVEDVQERATQKAPDATSYLRGSAYNGVTRDGDVITGTVGFHAVTADGQHSYALIQHEDMSLSHSGPAERYENGVKYTYMKTGEAKFLEKAVLEVASDFTGRLAEGVQSVVDRL